MTWKRLLIIGVIAIIGFVLGRLAFRAFLNLLMEKECLFLFAY